MNNRKLRSFIREQVKRELQEVEYADVFAKAMIGREVTGAGVSRNGKFYVRLDSGKIIEFESKNGELFLSARK